MRTLLVSGLALVLAAPVCTQGVLYSPKNLDTKTEGTLYGYYHGRYPNGHVQYADGENAGKAAVIKSISMRLDARNFTAFLAPGRKWTNVKVSVAEGSVSSFTTRFSTNMTTTPKVIYNKAWQLPSFVGTPKNRPAKYGGTSGEYTLPFDSSWVYTGKGDIVHDWLYSGGTLDNKVNWTNTSSRVYYFDSYANACATCTIGSTYRYVPTTRLNNLGTTRRCNDSAHATSTGAYMLAIASLYPQYYTIHNYRNNLVFYHYSYYTAQEAPVIHAMGFNTVTAGVDVGTGCNKFHISGPMFLFPMATPPASVQASAYTGYRLNFIPWEKSLANVTAIMQGVWTDSKTNKLQLTQAREFTTPAGFPGPPPKRNQTYHSTRTNATGFGPYNIYWANPAFAYGLK
jgi:hypothetical protein